MYTLSACADASDLSLSSYHATAYKFVVLSLSENLSALETVYKKVRERSNSLIAIWTTIQYEATRDILRTNCYSDATTFVCHMTQLYSFFPDFFKLHVV